MNTADKLTMLKTLIRWAGMLAVLLMAFLFGSQWLILALLPPTPSPALIGLIQTGQTGLVGALAATVGGIAAAVATYFSFRSAKETSGDE